MVNRLIEASNENGLAELDQQEPSQAQSNELPKKRIFNFKKKTVPLPPVNESNHSDLAMGEIGYVNEDTPKTSSQHNSTVNEAEISLIQSLLLPGREAMLDNIRNNNSFLIEQDLIIVQPDHLDDNNLNKLDSLNSVIKYFDPDAW